MFSINNLIWGLLLMTVGVLAIKYTFQLVGFTGRQEWIERYAGSGTTYVAFKIIALFAIMIGILLVTGLSHAFFNFLLSPLRNFFVSFKKT